MSETVRPRKCSTEKDSQALARGSKKIYLPIEREEYECILPDAKAFRACIDSLIDKHPELFPSTIGQGYKLHDVLPESKKLPGLRLRRIEVQAAPGESGVFTISPAFVMPYMAGYTDDVEKALFLRQFEVPAWALAYVFGRDEMYWHRLEQQFGRNSVVGTTVRQTDKLPADVLADEKHSRLNGEKVYIATTVAEECVLGVSLALDAGSDSLEEAYGHFKTEAQNVAPDYQPLTVNTDGWNATQAAWRRLFPAITLILCFLHSFLKIRDRCKRMKDHYPEIKQRVWDAYHAPDRPTFRQEVAALKKWAVATLPDGSGLEAVLKLCAKVPEFLKAYDHPTAHRTSNMIDRHLDALDRYLYSCQYFHGHLMSAEYRVRAWALLHNFRPYCPRAKISDEYISRAHRLNGFVYHDNWLQNLLISTSMGGYRR